MLLMLPLYFADVYKRQAITLYDATYDNFGRLLTKQYHSTSTNKLTYTYNLRSWLTGISGTRCV